MGKWLENRFFFFRHTTSRHGRARRAMNTASTATKLRTRGFGSLGLPNCIDFLILRHGRARRAMNTASTATKLRTRGFGSLGLPNCIGFLILRHGRARRAMNTASTATKLRTRGFGSLGLPNCIGFLIFTHLRPGPGTHFLKRWGLLISLRYSLDAYYESIICV